MDDGIKALFLAASAIHFGVRSAAGASEALTAQQVQAENAHPEELTFGADIYRRIQGRRSRRHRGSRQLGQWSLMPGN